jgi:hypothetical protein
MKMHVYTSVITSCRILLRMSNVSDKSYRETQNTNFMFINIFPEIVPCGNVEKYGTARRTLIIFNTQCFLLATVVTQTCHNVMFYVHFLLRCVVSIHAVKFSH